MSIQLQFRRGSTAQHSTFTGALAEVTVDITKKTAVVHDGATAGGIPLAKESHVHAGVYEPVDANIVRKDVATVFTANQTQLPTTASSASYTWDTAANPNLELTTSGNLVLASPINRVAGSFYYLEIIYGGTHTVTWNSAFKGMTGATLTSTAGAKDAFMFREGTDGAFTLVGFRANVGV